MGTREVPLGINTSTGAVAVILFLVVPASLTGPGIDARLGVLAVGLVAFAAAIVDLTAVAITVGMAFLLFDGFVEGNNGDLVWHGRADVIRLAVLCSGGAVGLMIGYLRQWRQRATAALQPSAGPMVPRQRTSPEPRSTVSPVAAPTNAPKDPGRA